MTTLALATLVSSCRISKGGKHITRARTFQVFFQMQASAYQVSAWTKVGTTRARLLMATKRTQTQAIHMNATEVVCGALVSINHADQAPTSAITFEGCLEMRQVCLKLVSKSGERIEPAKGNKLHAGIV